MIYLRNSDQQVIKYLIQRTRRSLKRKYGKKIPFNSTIEAMVDLENRLNNGQLYIKF